MVMDLTVVVETLLSSLRALLLALDLLPPSEGHIGQIVGHSLFHREIKHNFQVNLYRSLHMVHCIVSMAIGLITLQTCNCVQYMLGYACSIFGYYDHCCLPLSLANRRCSCPSAPAFGYVTRCSTSSVTYNCRTGYTLSGSSSRVCLSTGRWNGTAPQCIRYRSSGQLGLQCHIIYYSA